jgi:hypothetical protein
MALKPYHEIAGEAPRPQFLLKGRDGREYGVVEHYETDGRRPHTHVLLEFHTPDPGAPAARPRIWLDLGRWAVAEGHGKNLPDADFEPGLNAYLQGFPEDERELRRERARKALRFELIRLSDQGYSVAYQEMFPGELTREDFPRVRIGKTEYVVDDQYLIRPGDFRNQVTLVLVEDRPGSDPAAPALLANWLFGEGYEILQTDLDEDQARRALEPLVGNPELEKIYKERLAKMRREGTLLGVKPKPYAPRGGAGSGPRP